MAVFLFNRHCAYLRYLFSASNSYSNEWWICLCSNICRGASVFYYSYVVNTFLLYGVFGIKENPAFHKSASGGKCRPVHTTIMNISPYTV